MFNLSNVELNMFVTEHSDLLSETDVNTFCTLRAVQYLCYSYSAWLENFVMIHVLFVYPTQ